MWRDSKERYDDFDVYEDDDLYDDGGWRRPPDRRKRLFIGVGLALLASIATFYVLVGARAEAPAVTGTATGDRVVPATTTGMLRGEPDITDTPNGTEVPTSDPAPTARPQDFDPSALGQRMIDGINRDRRVNGLTPVEGDPVAALAGQRHAEDMVAHDYFSHWNREGWGPDHRYTQAGGTHAVSENLYAYEYVYEDGRGAPIKDWGAVIENAQAGLMDSPGHRANILDPAHTHVGIGLAYDASTGQFRLAQEFTNQYVQLVQPLPLQAELGQHIVVQGRFTGQDLSDPLLSVAYEAFPAPLDFEALAQTGTYTSAAESIDTRMVDFTFDETVTLDNDLGPGLYHVRLFVETPDGQALVFDHIIKVH
jgi:uncharacterized protein YkwD